MVVAEIVQIGFSRIFVHSKHQREKLGRSGMDRSERFYKIKNLLRGVGAVPTATLLRELEVSRATLHRDLEYLRDRMETPIVYDQVRRGYRPDGAAPGGDGPELAG